MPVQLPLAHSGWLFKEENEEADVKPRLAGPREEDMELDVPAVKGTLSVTVSSPFLQLFPQERACLRACCY